MIIGVWRAYEQNASRVNPLNLNIDLEQVVTRVVLFMYKFPEKMISGRI